jgi:signal transduction histidine kinase
MNVSVLRTDSIIREKFGHPTRMGWLATSVVHDLRNPLGTICTGVELLMDSHSSTPQVRRLANSMHIAALRMRHLLADLVTAAQGTPEKLEPCDLREIVVAASEAALACNEHVNVQLTVAVPCGIQLLLTRSLMERVFFNLITNSLESMPCGGSVWIRARKSGNCIVTEVEDNGPGIPANIRERLFEPFATTGKPGGLGLGLALARQTILDHGGEMWLKPGRGAQFTIQIPLRGA